MKDFLLKILIFLNLMEDNHKKLSISKVYMWSTIWLTPYTAMYHPDNMAAIIAAGSTQGMAMINYGLKRYGPK